MVENEKVKQNLKEGINQDLVELNNLSVEPEDESLRLKNLTVKVKLLESIDKMDLEQQKIDNQKSENDRRMSIEESKVANESTRIENDYNLKMEEFTFKREELKFKTSQLEQDMKQFELDCETRVKEAKWGALWHGIGEALGISRFMLWRHDRKNMYKSECVIQHKEMNVVTPTQKEINKEYADLIRKEIK